MRYYVHEVRNDGNEYFWGDPDGDSFATKDDAEQLVSLLQTPYNRGTASFAVEEYRVDMGKLDARNIPQ